MTIRKFPKSQFVNVMRPTPTVTFAINGTMVFNSSLSKDVPNGFNHVELYLDDDPPLLTVKFIDEASNDSLPFRRYRVNCIISIRRFLQWAGWDRSISRVYKARYVERAKSVVIDISKPIAEDSQNRMRNSKGQFAGHGEDR